MPIKQRFLSSTSPQNGNALFLILIAVALFAALSYAITKSGRGSGSIERETQSLDAAQAIQYIGSIQAALQRLLLSGCSDTTVSFHYDSDGDSTLETNGDDDYYNPTSPVNYSCHVFHENGGNLTWQNPPVRLTTDNWRISGAAPARGIGTTDVSELVIWMTDLSIEVCIELNKKLNAPLTGGGEPIEEGSGLPTDLFIGTYGIPGGQIDGMFGYSAGCLNVTNADWLGGPAGDYWAMFYVLHPR
ncbi:MAG: hypothetical protein OXT65_10215 [Alphaproteobacteria bacterium]|nr:hypothetical protein [Alphaproteobacteria bacterium]